MYFAKLCKTLRTALVRCVQFVLTLRDHIRELRKKKPMMTGRCYNFGRSWRCAAHFLTPPAATNAGGLRLKRNLYRSWFVLRPFISQENCTAVCVCLRVCDNFVVAFSALPDRNVHVYEWNQKRLCSFLLVIEMIFSYCVLPCRFWRLYLAESAISGRS